MTHWDYDRMNIIRAYKFRIYPDEKRQKGIDDSILLGKELYNKLLEKARERYKKDTGFRVNMNTLNDLMKEAINENRDFLKLYSQTRQNVFNRLTRAYENFFRRLKERESGKRVKAGFPRFKSRDTYRSITYPQDNGAFSIDKGRLRVARIGTMRIEQHRPMEGKIKAMTLKREAGKYYAIFSVEQQVEVPKVMDTKPVGLDMDLNSFIAMSNGTKIEKPKFLNARRKRIALWQRRISKRRKGSRNRERAKAHLQREWEHVTNQSNDFAHKLSTELVNSGYTSFAVERLGIRNMVKNHNLAQSIHNASWNRFMQMLSYKAESAGLRVITVDARNTTQECSGCGHVKGGVERLTLDDRTYQCNACGLTMDRDINASMVILKRALNPKGSDFDSFAVKAREGHSRSNAWGDATSVARRAPQAASRNQEHTSGTISGGSPRL